MPATTPAVKLYDDADDFVHDLDLEANYSGHSCIDLIAKLTECHYAFFFCARRLEGQGYEHSGYGEARALLDTALLHLNKAKWLIGGITGAYNGVRLSADKAADAAAGWAAAEDMLALVGEVRASLGDKAALYAIAPRQPELDYLGTEVLRADGFPVVPAICPIVVVRGSSYEMGYQYAQQTLQIFGEFIFSRFAALRFTSTRLEVISKFEAQLRQHTPEILDMCRGWADAVTDSGLPMAYENVLHMWASTDEPASRLEDVSWPFLGNDKLLAAMYFGQQAFIQSARKQLEASAAAGLDSPLERCSGFCAWGEATSDGRLKAASTTDHDCWMQVTIVAYPDEGNDFIYTPFSAHGGWIPGMGVSGMAGHPGMNNRGVAYVHHGGEPHVMEPEHSWGYGVMRGATTFHGLRYANSARDAYDQVMSYPIGNVGCALGSAGGQWADHHNGYVFESRYRSEEHPEGLVRTCTFDHQGKSHSILYTGNSSLHADASSLNHGHAEGVMEYDIERGWHTYDASKFAASNMIVSALRMCAGPTGAERNKCFFDLSIPASGHIDDTFVERLYATPQRDIPAAEDYPERVRQIAEEGYRFAASPGHRGNAFTSLMFPDDGDQGLYSGCVGPINYHHVPRGATHGFYYYGETNAYWTLRLADTAEGMAQDARARLLEDSEAAARELSALDAGYAGKSHLDGFLTAARAALTAGDQAFGELSNVASAREESAVLSRALRLFTTGQVRARQVLNALAPIKVLDYPGGES
ncbi:MAG: hypothetical protein AAGI11_13535 [Pseudomonadota bacterium]